MKQILRAIWEFFFPKKVNVAELDAIDQECCQQKETCDNEDCNKNELPLVQCLEAQKAKAIAECDGCENEVFVLRFNNEDVDYAKSLNQLIVRNKLPKNKTYAFWNNKQQLNANDKAGLLLNQYDIVKLA